MIYCEKGLFCNFLPRRTAQATTLDIPVVQHWEGHTKNIQTMILLRWFYSAMLARQETNEEGRKEIFYLTSHSTYFYLQLYGVKYMVKDHSDSEKGNPLPPHGLLFPITIKGSFIGIIPQTGYHIPQSFLHQSRSTGWNEK